MDDEKILEIIEKRGVVLRDIINLTGRSCSYWDMLHEVVDDPHHNAQLSKKPPQNFVRVTILLDPVTYDECKDGVV